MSVHSHTRALLLILILVLQATLVSAQSDEADSTMPEGVGFHGRLNLRSTVVAPYEEPDYTFSAAMYPRTAPPLSNKLVYTLKAADKGSFDNNALSFSLRMYRGVELIPVSVDASEYHQRRVKANIAERWKSFATTTVTRVQQGTKSEGVSIGVDLPKRFDQMFGEGGANLRVTGSRRITFSGRSQWDDVASSGINKQSKFPALNMEQISRFSIQGTIGTKISVSVAQDNQTDIPLANRLIIRYKGDEDDVLKTIEAGNTNLAIPNTRFVGYSQSISGLFGIKTEAKLGNLALTAIASQEKGSSESATVSAAGEENAEFRRDHAYLEGRIYDLGYPGEIGPADSVTKIEVYEEPANRNDNTYADSTYLDNGPNNTDDYDKKGVLMVEVPREQYELLYVKNTSYSAVALVFYSSRYSSRAVGVRMTITKNAADGIPSNESIVEVGYVDGLGGAMDTLRCLQPVSEYNKKDNPAWHLMWRNCYMIPKNIQIEDIDVKVYKGLTGREGQSSSLDYQKVGEVAEDAYIKILGLDQVNSLNAALPDGKIDDNPDIFRPEWGMIIFPERYPFISNRTFTDASGNETDTLAVKMPHIYEYNSTTEKIENSQYYIQVSTKARSATIRLGRANVIEGSERVLLNGRPLVKGRDYDISYEMGQVNLLTDDATDPNNDIKVEFQYAPFLALQKKTLLGMRAEYDRSENFKVGTTVLYKSDKAQERKPRVGQETSKAMVTDVDVAFGLNPRFITSAIDALPFLSAEADSRIKVTAEVAQSHPNPNVEGEAYIDDFESAVELQSLGIVRTNWTLSSKPVFVQDREESRGEDWTRGTIRWHNPPRIAKEEVYAGETVAGQGALQPLRLIFRPHGYKFSGTAEDPCSDSTEARSWGGIMRYFNNRVDENRVQLFEVRAKGGKGILHFDFGRISTDVNGNGRLENEDQDNNDFITVIDDKDPKGEPESSEDMGLDLVPDSLEVGRCGDSASSANPDPAGDDWWYDYKGKTFGSDKRPPISQTLWESPGYKTNVENPDHWLHYEWVNGTEGNIDDDAVQGLPDMEALQGNTEEKNAYFTFALDTDTSTATNPFVVEGSGRNGWYTYRVPVRDPGILDTVIVGAQTLSWADVTHVRVWFEQSLSGRDSLDHMDSIWIADWGFVQSNWSDTLYTSESDNLSEFYAASVSEETGTFTPPPGVEPYVDQVNNVTELQRGLALVFTDLQPGAEGVCQKDLLTAESYSGYRRLKMYVHGDENLDPTDSLMLYFRLGRDSANYYEYRHFVQAGWAADNEVDIDFNEITGLKDLAEKAAKENKGRVEDSTEIYRVVGKPSINEVLYLAASVKNLSGRPISGEIWLDELRVTDVRRDVGTAARVTVNGSLSDIITYGGTYEHKDAYFRGLAQATRGGSVDNLGSGKESNDFSVNTSINVNRFLPRSWGARIPVSYVYSESETVPLLRTNSDVVLPAETRAEEKSTMRSVKINASESFTRKGGGLLFDAILNRQKVSGSYSRTHQRSVNNPYMFSESYNLKADFDMGVTKPPELPIFFFTKSIPLLKRASGSKLSLYPRKWLWNASFARSLSARDDVDYNRTSSFSRTFDGRMDLTYQMFPTLTFDYGMTTKRDLTDPTLVNISLRNPKLGLENNYNQTFKVAYDPKLFTFLTGTYAYSSTYGDTYERNTRRRSTTLTVTWSVSGEFKHELLFGKSRKGRTDRGGSARGAVRGGVRPEDQPQPEKDKDKEKEKEKEQGPPFYEPVLKGMRFLTGWLMPLRYQHTQGFNRAVPGVGSRLPWRYRFGLDKYADFETSGSTKNPSMGKSESWDLGSGFTLLGGITTTVSYKDSRSEALTTIGADRQRSIKTSWPEMSIQIRRFTKLPLIKKYVNWFIDVFSPRTAYSRQINKSLNLDRGFTLSRSETISRSPLLALNLKVFERLSITSSYGVTKGNETKNDNTTGNRKGESKSVKKTISASSKYSFSAPGGISIPLLGKLKFKSMVTIDMSVQYSSNMIENLTQKGFVPQTNSTSFSASPSILYTFSSQIRGGLTMRWQDTNDVVKHRKSHVREIQIWTEIHF